MYLNLLEENQKELFLGLCKHAVEADGEVHANEEELLLQYCNELGYVKSIEFVQVDIDSILNELKINCTKVQLNIILFEILGLLLSDSKYHSNEKEFAEKISTSFEIDKSLVDSYIEKLNDYNRLVEEITLLVL